MKLLNVSVAIILLFSCTGNPKTIDEKLVGSWKGYLMDPLNGEKIEPLIMEFTIDNDLIYTIGEGDMQNIMTTTYWTKGNTIYIKRPDNQKVEKGKYEIKDNKLVMIDGRVKNEFVKK